MSNIIGKARVCPVQTRRGEKLIEKRIEGKFTRAQAIARGKAIGDKLKSEGKNGSIAIALYYDGDTRPWKRGYFTKFGDPMYLYEHSDSDIDIPDPEYYKKFVIYLTKGGPTYGNKSNNK